METKNTGTQQNNTIQFKSYYVVWKHFFRKNTVDEKESLNRTM